MSNQWKPVIISVFLLLSMAVSCVSHESGCTEAQIRSNETVREQLACIYDVVNSPEVVIAPGLLTTNSITYRAAIQSLLASGFLVEVETLGPAPEGYTTLDVTVPGYHPTAEGMDYLYKHKHPARFWFKQNWFPLVIAVFNAAIGGVSAWIGWQAYTNLRGRRGRNRQ